MNEQSAPAFCPNCGKPVAATANFCQHCAHPLTETASAAHAVGGTAQDGARRRLPILLLCGLIGLAVIALVSALISRQPSAGDSYSGTQSSSSQSSATTRPANQSVNVTITSPSTPTPSNPLAATTVQQAVRNFMRAYTKGGDINVEGVREIPNQNAATVNLRFANWICSTTYEGGLSTETPPPVTRDRYGMPSSAFGLRLVTYNTSGQAVLERYNDGRWMLKQVRVGDGFNAVTVSGTLEVR